MARPLRIQFPGAFYFVTSRANDDRTIFVSRKDREKFLEILSIAHKRFGFIVHAYTIMPHYYQLLVETPHANISKGMQFINSNYNTHYLFRHSWVGHLFNGRFKAILVDPETYLEEVSRMIHLTAIKEKIVTRPEEYEWSSYHYFVHDKPAPDFLNVDFTLRRDGANLFVAMERYRNFVLQGVDQKIPNPLKKIVKQTILGSAEFSARMVELYEKAKQKIPVVEESVSPSPISAERVLKAIDAQDIANDKLKNKMKIYFLRRYTSLTLNEVSAKCGKEITNTAVSKVISRLDTRRTTDSDMDQIMTDIDKRVQETEKRSS